MQTPDTEQIILVDDTGHPVGVGPKLASHHARTPLHQAFSCFLFDPQGRFLVTRRALTKKVFPGVWTNSCCGHPAPDEAVEDAIQRRLKYELGLAADSIELAVPHFRYTARYRSILENEICPVYLARTSQEPKPNPDEVAAYEWIPWTSWLAELARRPRRYSKWCREETAELIKVPNLKNFISAHSETV